MSFGRQAPATASSMPSPWKFGFVRQLHVSPNGADNAAGTLNAPLKTIGAALRKAKAFGSGTEIIVRAGTYREGELLVDFDGTPAQWNAIRGYPGERPKIVGTQSWQLLHLRGSYFLLEGLHLNGSKIGTTTSDGTPIKSRSDLIAWGKRQSHCLWNGENCGSGVYVAAQNGRSLHHVVVRDNIVQDFPGGGISTSSSDYVLIERNQTHNNSFISFYGHSGISVWQSKSSSSGNPAETRILVRNNVSFANHQYVPSTAIGLDHPTDGNGIIIDSNRDLGYPFRIRAENNIVFDNGGSGIHAFRSDHVDLVNNTAFHNSAAATQNDGEIFVNTSAGSRIYNNILSAAPGRRINSNWANSGLQTGNNILHGTVAPDLRGASDLVADPKLTRMSRSFAKLDPTPQAGSPALDKAAASLFAATDYYGRTPVRGRDIGAVERR